jgi:hypothetical protein
MPLLASLPAGQLDGTKTSAFWKRKPGNFDRLNLRMLWPQLNRWGIPHLDPEPFIPAVLAAYHDPAGISQAAADRGAVHFFIDDYRFEAVWNSPERGLERVRRAGAALSPDFSLWRGMPLALQLWQVYRSRWCGAYWQYHGVKVVPTVSWAGPESFGFCFEGLPEGVPVAVSAVGVRDGEGRDLFARGLAELVRRVRPSRLLVYGGVPPWVSPEVPVTEYPSFWGERGKGQPGGRQRR